jgi:MFS family permease
LQGLSAGVELGSVSVYLAEIATPRTKGFWVSWQSASQQVAVVFTAVIGLLLARWIEPEPMKSWGWRVAFFVGLSLVPFIFVLRSTLNESTEFAARKVHPTVREILRTLVAHFGVICAGTMMVLMTTVCFYLITAYTPTFGKTVLHLSAEDSLVVTVCVGASNFLWLPLGGALSDRIGRKPILVAASLLAVVTAYPILSWLVTDPSFGRLLAALLWLSFLFGAYNGAMVVYLTEVVPPTVRTSGFSLAYSLATCIGGFTPAIATWLITRTNNAAMPGVWLSAAALLALIGAVVSRPFEAHAR